MKKQYEDENVGVDGEAVPATEMQTVENGACDTATEKPQAAADSVQTDGGSGKRKNKKADLALKIVQWVGFGLLCVIFTLLLINSLLCVFMKHYYPTYGDYRLFAIVSDSMEGDTEDAIPTGSLVVDRVPKSEDEIVVGTVVTYEYKPNKNTIILLTHRVIEIRVDPDTGKKSYVTKGDNAPAADSVRPTYEDIVGIYTGNKCEGLGYLVGFLQDSAGAITLIIILLIIVLTALIVHFVNLINVWRNVAVNALKKSGSVLKEMDNIEELGTISDVIGIVSKDPEGREDIRRKDEKLNWYIKMSALPKRPYPADLEEYLQTAGKDVKPVSVPKLRYAEPDEVDGGETSEVDGVIEETVSEDTVALEEPTAEPVEIAVAPEPAEEPAVVSEVREPVEPAAAVLEEPAVVAAEAGGAVTVIAGETAPSVEKPKVKARKAVKIEDIDFMAISSVDKSRKPNAQHKHNARRNQSAQRKRGTRH